MAKRKGIAGKIVAGALALCVAASCVSLLGYTSRDNNGNWFGGLHWADNNITADGGDVKNENGGAVVTEGESDGMLMLASAIPLNSYEEYGVSPLAENAYSLSVTYTPEDTTYKQTNFTAAFKNPSSPWASGKSVSDYVTINATGDTTATLTVLKPFSEQIIVTAANNKNSSVKATTTVDYVGTWNGDITNVMPDLQSYDIEFETSSLINGTISPDTTNCITVTFNIAESIANRVTAKGYTMSSSVDYTFTPEEIGGAFGITTVQGVFMKAGGFKFSSATNAQEIAYWQALSSVILNGSKPADLAGNEIFDYTITSKRVYNGTTYSAVTITEGVVELSDYTGFEVVATSMSTSSPSIIAG